MAATRTRHILLALVVVALGVLAFVWIAMPDPIGGPMSPSPP
jgi:hypothetical protein